jgi:polar amino acid transport system permease protein
MRDLTLFDIILSLLWATQWTVVLSFIALIGGGIVGIILTLMRISSRRPIKWVSRMYIEFIQGTPLLMQIFLIFFGIPILVGFDVPAWTSASIALIAYTSAFMADIWRGSVEAIPKAQWEAGTSLGLSYIQQFRYVIMPQAVKISIPPSIGFSVQVIKNTSLTSIIGYVELTRQGQILNNVTFQPFLIFSLVGIIYFGLCYPLSLYSKKLEEKLARGER